MATASDNFNRTENPLASGWSAQSGIASTLKANGTAAIGVTASVDNVSIWTNDVFGGDQFSEAVLVAATGGGGPYVRGSASASQGYALAAFTNLFSFYKFTGTFNQIGADFGLGTTGGAGHTYRVEAQGTGTVTFSIKDNGVLLTTRTDSTSPPADGAAGLYCLSDSISWTSWQGGDLPLEAAQGRFIGALL